MKPTSKSLFVWTLLWIFPFKSCAIWKKGRGAMSDDAVAILQERMRSSVENPEPGSGSRLSLKTSGFYPDSWRVNAVEVAKTSAPSYFGLRGKSKSTTVPPVNLSVTFNEPFSGQPSRTANDGSLEQRTIQSVFLEAITKPSRTVPRGTNQQTFVTRPPNRFTLTNPFTPSPDSRMIIDEISIKPPVTLRRRRPEFFLQTAQPFYKSDREKVFLKSAAPLAAPVAASMRQEMQFMCPCVNQQAHMSNEITVGSGNTQRKSQLGALFSDTSMLNPLDAVSGKPGIPPLAENPFASALNRRRRPGSATRPTEQTGDEPSVVHTDFLKNPLDSVMDDQKLMNIQDEPKMSTGNRVLGGSPRNIPPEGDTIRLPQSGLNMLMNPLGSVEDSDGVLRGSFAPSRRQRPGTLLHGNPGGTEPNKPVLVSDQGFQNINNGVRGNPAAFAPNSLAPFTSLSDEVAQNRPDKKNTWSNGKLVESVDASPSRSLSQGQEVHRQTQWRPLGAGSAPADVVSSQETQRALSMHKAPGMSLEVNPSSWGSWGSSPSDSANNLIQNKQLGISGGNRPFVPVYDSPSSVYGSSASGQLNNGPGSAGYQASSSGYSSGSYSSSENALSSNLLSSGNSASLNAGEIVIDIYKPVRKVLTVDNMSPICAKDVIKAAVHGLSPPGTVIGTVEASDPGHAPLSWSLDSDLPRVFGINRKTGQLGLLSSPAGINFAEMTAKATNPQGFFCITNVRLDIVQPGETPARSLLPEEPRSFSRDVYQARVPCSAKMGEFVLRAKAKSESETDVSYMLEDTNEFSVDIRGTITVGVLDLSSRNKTRKFRVVAVDKRGEKTAATVEVTLDNSTCYPPQFDMFAYLYDVVTDCTGVRPTDRIAQIIALPPSPPSKLRYSMIGTDRFEVDPMSGIISSRIVIDKSQRLPEFGIVVRDTFGRSNTATVRISVSVNCSTTTRSPLLNDLPIELTGVPRPLITLPTMEIGSFFLRVACEAPVGTVLGEINPRALTNRKEPIRRLSIRGTDFFGVIAPSGKIVAAKKMPDISDVVTFDVIADTDLVSMVAKVSVRTECEPKEVPKILPHVETLPKKVLGLHALAKPTAPWISIPDPTIRPSRNNIENNPWHSL